MKNKIKNFMEIFKGYLMIISIFMIFLIIMYLIGWIYATICENTGMKIESITVWDYLFCGALLCLCIFFILCLLYLIVDLLVIIIVPLVGRMLFFIKNSKNPITKEKLDELNFDTAREYLEYVSDRLSIKRARRLMHWEKEYVECNYSKEVLKNVVLICKEKFGVELNFSMSDISISLYLINDEKTNIIYEKINLK